MPEKISNDLVERIGILAGEGKSQPEIAKELGIGLGTVNKYIHKGVQTKMDLVSGLSKEQERKLKLIETFTMQDLQMLLKGEAKPLGEKVVIETEKARHALFGLFSDVHMGSKVCNYEGLHKYYDRLQSEGVEKVYCGGDLVDGYHVYKGHIFEVAKHSVQEQVDDVVDNFPKREGMDTHYILGNHDESWLTAVGYDISKTIDNLRSDMHGMGFYNAQIEMNGVKIELHHGMGGQSYSQSYKIQKYCENMDPKKQPHVFGLGHYHGAMYMFYRKIHAFMTGSMQGQTNFSKRIMGHDVMGGWLVDISLDEKGGTKIKMEFIDVKA